MTPIDSLIAAKKAIAASEAAELSKDYDKAYSEASIARMCVSLWMVAVQKEMQKMRRDKGMADTTEVMAEAYRHEHRQ